MTDYPTVIALLDKINVAMRPSSTEAVETRFLEGMLMLNAHAQFLAAIRIATSGASAATFPLLRVSVESALYAVIAAQSEENRTAWLQRGTNLKRCRKVFTVEVACRFLDDCDQNLANTVRAHYNAAIDHSGHPNPRSIFPSINFDDQEGGLKSVSLTYLSGAGSTLTMRSLVACIEVGVLILFLMRHALPEASVAVDAFHIASTINEEYVTIFEDMGYCFHLP